MPHFLKFDFRLNSLHRIIEGLNTSIIYLENKRKEEIWYDILFFLEDTEPIYGLAFIAFQNYINSSIKDLPVQPSTTFKIYKKDYNIEGYNKSSIELIICLANYFKHRDEGNLRSNTTEILDCFKLKYRDEVSIEESPVFEGLKILSRNNNLLEVLEIVRNWRERLWQ